jgi:hypothetical protein
MLLVEPYRRVLPPVRLAVSGRLDPDPDVRTDLGNLLHDDLCLASVPLAGLLRGHRQVEG